MAQTTSKSKEPSQSSATTMADLMKSVSQKLVTFKKGDIIPGVITKLTPQEILVNINAKTEAVVLEKEKRLLRNMLASFHVGDSVTVSILNPESDLGHPVVSLRRHLEDLMWKQLETSQKKKEALEVTVNEITKGGYLVTTQTGLHGFLPNSQTSFISSVSKEGSNMKITSASEIIGKKIKVYVLELGRQARKIIFSQKPVLQTKDFEDAVKHLSIGQKVEGIISNITSFGVFVMIPVAPKDGEEQFVDGFIHSSEFAWDNQAEGASDFEVGKKITTVVVEFDNQTKRVNLSIKRLTKDPFEDIADKLSVDQKAEGVVSEINSQGVVVRLSDIESDQPIEGLIRKDKVPVNVSYEIGQKVSVTIANIDKNKHKIQLIPVLQAKPIGYR